MSSMTLQGKYELNAATDVPDIGIVDNDTSFLSILKPLFQFGRNRI